jgi:hypothetical protein
MSELLRTCRVCGKKARSVSELEQFKKDLKGLYGRENICKKCKNEQTKDYYQDRKRHFREYQRKYRAGHKKGYNKRNRLYRERHPEKIKAEILAHRLVPLGSHCVLCGATKNLQRHHPDYSKPLEIVTLCQPCHFRVHQNPSILGDEKKP